MDYDYFALFLLKQATLSKEKNCLFLSDFQNNDHSLSFEVMADP